MSCILIIKTNNLPLMVGLVQKFVDRGVVETPMNAIDQKVRENNKHDYG